MLCGVGSYRHLLRPTLAISATHLPFHALLKQRWLNQACPDSPVPNTNGAVSLNMPENVPAESSAQPSPGLLAAVHNLFHRGRIRSGALKLVRKSTLLSKHLLDRDMARKLAEAMVQTPSPQRARQVLTLAHKLGCPLKQNAYECVAFQLAMAGCWHLIPPLVSLGTRHTGRTTVRLLNWRARALIELDHFAHLELVPDEFEKWHLKPNRTTFHLLISGHIRNRNLVNAKDCLRSMEAHGFPVDSSTHSLIVSAYRSLGPDAHVQDRGLEAARDPSCPTATAVLNGLMHLRIEAGDFSGFLRVLSLFDHLSPAVAFMSSHAGEPFTLDGGENSKLERHDHVPGTSYPKQIPSTVPFDAATISILIDYLVMQNDAPRALTVYRNMVAIGVRPDAGTVAALVRLYFMVGDEVSAIHIVAKLCNRREQFFRYLGPLVSKSIESHDIPLPATTCIPLSIGIFNALMKGLLALHDSKGAYAVLQLMHVNNIKPDARTIELLVAHLDKGKQHGRLLRLLRIFLPGNVRPTLRHAHIILRSILLREKRLRYGLGWHVAAAKLLGNRRDKTQHVTRPTRDNARPFDPIAGIDIPDKASYRSLMNPIMQSLATRRIRSDRATFALRIRHEAVNKADPALATSVFQTMLARGLHPNEYHFSALMEGYTRQGNMRAAETVLQSAERTGIQPNVVMFTILIVGHAQQGSPESAVRTFRRMIAAGVQPDVPVIDAVTSAYFIVGAHAMAKRVLCALWCCVQPFPRSLRSAPLKRLIRVFRTLHKSNQGNRRAISADEQLMMHRKLECLMETWRRGHTLGDTGRGRMNTTSNHRTHTVHRAQLKKIGVH